MTKKSYKIKNGRKGKQFNITLPDALYQDMVATCEQLQISVPHNTVARQVLEAFWPAWKRAEQQKRAVIDDVMQRIA